MMRYEIYKLYLSLSLVFLKWKISEYYKLKKKIESIQSKTNSDSYETGW